MCGQVTGTVSAEHSEGCQKDNGIKKQCDSQMLRCMLRKCEYIVSGDVDKH